MPTRVALAGTSPFMEPPQSNAPIFQRKALIPNEFVANGAIWGFKRDGGTLSGTPKFSNFSDLRDV